MKKPLLLSALAVLLLALTTGIIYAQVASTSIVDMMKAVAHSFTLSSTLNPTDTGLTSDPIKGKKTGDILTAGEWNRVLELVGEGEGSSSGGSGAVFRVRLANNYNSSESVPLVVHWDTEDFDVGNQFDMTSHKFKPTAAGYYYLSSTVCFDDLNSSNGTGSDQVAAFISKNGVAALSNLGTDMFQGTNIVTYSGLLDPCVAVSGVVYSDGDDDFTVRAFQDDVSTTPIKAHSVFSGFQIGGGSDSSGNGELVLSEMSPTTYANLVDAVNYCRNLTEQGMTNWKFPTYGDLVNFISNTYSGDFLWVADFDGTQTASHSITKDYFGSIRLSDGYWSVSTLADGANKVRCVAQTGGASSGGSTSGGGDTFTFLDTPVLIIDSGVTKTDKTARVLDLSTIAGVTIPAKAKAVQLITHCANYANENQSAGLKLGKTSASFFSACSANGFGASNDVDNNNVIIPLATDGKSISYEYHVPSGGLGGQISVRIQGFIVGQ